MRTNFTCPKCEECDLFFEDNSFEHEFGFKEERFYYCDNCNETFNIDEIEEV